MGRLRRKKPASTKKKKQKSAARPDTQEMGLTNKKAVVPSVQKRPILTKKEVEAPKSIIPSGRVFQPAFVAKATQFLREVKIELKKVTWPSRKETIASTAVVIILVVIISSFLGLVDMGLSSLIRLVLN